MNNVVACILLLMVSHPNIFRVFREIEIQQTFLSILSISYSQTFFPYYTTVDDNDKGGLGLGCIQLVYTNIY